MKTEGRFSTVLVSASAGDTVRPITNLPVSRRATGRSDSRNIVRPPAHIRSASGLLSVHEPNGKTENTFPLNAEAVGRTENGIIADAEAIFRTANTFRLDAEAIFRTENGLLAREEGVCRFDNHLNISQMGKIREKMSQTARFGPVSFPVTNCQLLTPDP